MRSKLLLERFLIIYCCSPECCVFFAACCCCYSCCAFIDTAFPLFAHLLVQHCQETLYIAFTREETHLGDKYIRVLREGYVSMELAQNLLVMKTVSGIYLLSRYLFLTIYYCSPEYCIFFAACCCSYSCCFFIYTAFPLFAHLLVQHCQT